MMSQTTWATERPNIFSSSLRSVRNRQCLGVPLLRHERLRGSHLNPVNQRPRTRTAKVVAIVNILREHKTPVTAAVFAKMLAVSERTVYRYIAELEAQGVPIHGEAGIGYVLRPGLFMPPMALTEDEAEAVLLGLKLAGALSRGAFSEAVGSAIEKIEVVLSSAAKDVFRDPSISVDVFAASASPRFDLEPYLRAIRLHSRMAVRFEEAGELFDGAICPVALLVSPSEIELLSWNEKSQVFARFPLAGIVQAQCLHSRFPLNRARLMRIWESGRRLNQLSS